MASLAVTLGGSVRTQAITFTETATAPPNCLGPDVVVRLTVGRTTRIADLAGVVIVEGRTKDGEKIPLEARVVRESKVRGGLCETFDVKGSLFSKSHCVLVEASTTPDSVSDGGHSPDHSTKTCEACNGVHVNGWDSFCAGSRVVCRLVPPPSCRWHHLVLRPEERDCAVVLGDGSLLSESFRSDDDHILRQGFEFIA